MPREIQYLGKVTQQKRKAFLDFILSLNSQQCLGGWTEVGRKGGGGRVMFEEVWATLKNSSSQVVAMHNCPSVTGRIRKHLFWGFPESLFQHICWCTPGLCPPKHTTHPSCLSGAAPTQQRTPRAGLIGERQSRTQLPSFQWVWDPGCREGKLATTWEDQNSPTLLVGSWYNFWGGSDFTISSKSLKNCKIVFKKFKPFGSSILLPGLCWKTIIRAMDKDSAKMMVSQTGHKRFGQERRERLSIWDCKITEGEFYSF